MGRPRKELSAKTVEKLAALGCTVEDIADFYGCGRELIHERYADSLTRGRAREKMSIRRKRHIRAVQDGSDQMLIYLSKVRLGEHEDRSDVAAALAELIKRANGGSDNSGAIVD